MQSLLKVIKELFEISNGVTPMGLAALTLLTVLLALWIRGGK